MPDNTLEYFMWGFQPHYQLEAKLLAEKLLKALDPRFEPKVFLLGFLREDDPTRHPICIEPEDCGYHPSQFQTVDALAEILESDDSDSRIIHTLPQAQLNLDRRTRRKNQNRALLEILDQIAPKDVVSFASWPVRVAGFDVFVVMQLQRAHYESHYQLKPFLVHRHQMARSYLDATISTYFDICTGALRKPSPGENIAGLYEDAKYAALDAAEYFASRLRRVNFRTSGDFFETLNQISSLRYEQLDGHGKIVVAEAQHSNVRCEVTLTVPIPLSNHRAIRKLIEISSKGVSLLCDGWQIYGFGEVEGTYDKEREDLFEIIFTGHHDWSIVHGGQIMMRVAYNRPLPLLPKLDLDRFATDARRIFRGIEDTDLAQLMGIMMSVVDLGHGCQIVISEKAEQEADRLSPQATCIEPKILNLEMITKLCAIDGALLFDPRGCCHAVGVILDGNVSAHGDKSRGSRYNSAITYAENRDQCLILVVSDDGTIDLIPKLRPQLRRRDLESALEALEAVCEEAEVDEGKYRKAMNWLDSHRFYISPLEAVRINEIRDEVESRRKSELGAMYMIYENFESHPDMNDSFWLEE